MELAWAFSLPPDFRQSSNREGFRNVRTDSTELPKDNVESLAVSLPPWFIDRANHRLLAPIQGEKNSNPPLGERNGKVSMQELYDMEDTIIIVFGDSPLKEGDSKAGTGASGGDGVAW